MYAIAFDLVVASTEKHHPKGVIKAYTHIGAVLNVRGVRRVQGSLQFRNSKKAVSLEEKGDSLSPPFSRIENRLINKAGDVQSQDYVVAV